MSYSRGNAGSLHIRPVGNICQHVEADRSCDRCNRVGNKEPLSVSLTDR